MKQGNMTKTVWSILKPMVFIIMNMTMPIKPAPVSIRSARAVKIENATAVPPKGHQNTPTKALWRRAFQIT